ncbi:MAG: hypothetical protein ACLFU8_13695 [Anaerolineales bacterium]
MRQRRVTRLLGMLLLLGALLLAGVSRMPWHASTPVLAQEPAPTSTRPPPAPLPTSPPPPTAAPTRPPDQPAPAPAATATPSPSAIVLPVAGRTRGWVAGWLLLGGLAILIGGLLLHVRRR